MGKSGDRVKVHAQAAQWRIESLPAGDYRSSEPFKMGIWEWVLTVENDRKTNIRLHPADPHGKDIPVVSFILRVISYACGRRQILHPEVVDKRLRRWDDFVWVIDDEPMFSSKFIIDVQFTDLKILPDEVGILEPKSGWARKNIARDADFDARSALNIMLDDGIATDVTINAMDGSLAAHQAILAVRSPVFCKLFSHDSQEKKFLTVDITDTPVAICRTFIQYLYGDPGSDEFPLQRIPLLRLAEKYNVIDLRKFCEKSLIRDIDRNNVLERLHASHRYKLPELKSMCMRYLLEFGRLYDLPEEMTSFFGTADGELMGELCKEVVASSKAGPKD